MTPIVQQVSITDNRLSINSCFAISRLYQATLSCGKTKHVAVDCNFTLQFLYIFQFLGRGARVELTERICKLCKHISRERIDLP